MEHERFRSLPQDMQDWFQDFKPKPSPNLDLKLNNEAKAFFRETHEKFMSSREENTSSFVRFMQHNEDQFSQLLKSCSQATFVEFEQDGHEFTRNSTGSEWRTHSQGGEKCNKSIEENAVNASSLLPQNDNHIFSPENAFLQFRSIAGFPRFNPFMVSASVRNRRMCAESWSGSEKISMSRSSIECRSHSSYRYAADKIIQSCYEAYNISESESEDEEMVSNKSLPTSCHYSHELAASESDVSSLAPSEQCESHILEQQQRPLAIEAPPDSRQEKAYCIAMELLTTERSYVAILHLIDQIFHFRVDQENRAHNMFPQEVVPQMFSNIKSIYQFHHDFLLPQLEDRMLNWEKQRKIGDIMKNFAPFLKLYTEYVKNFDNAMNVINAVGAKNQRFAAIMEEIHQTPECGNLTLPHHMLSPIQRIPRYELLLKDYLKNLPEDSSDREDTEKALHLVSTAANHANEAMKKIDKFKKLLEVQEKISGAVDLISPTRELLKEGKIVKISARSGDHQERYLFLFSDLLLLCSPRLLPNRVGIGGITGPAYRLRAKFFMESIQVLEGDNLETANTFYIQDDHKTVELYTQTLEEKTAWLDALCVAIEELYKRKSSFKIGTEVSAPLNNELGKKHPQYIKIDSVHKCMDCGAGFGVMRRKHHCRACGLVVCGKCSNQKYPLPCEDDKVSRVCRQCYQTLAQQASVCSPEKGHASYAAADSDADAKENSNLNCSRGKGLLEVPANASCVLSGYLQLKCSKTWVRRWFALHPDFVLYSFRSDADERAMTATPLPGYAVDKVSEQKNESFSEKEKLFKMYHTKKIYYFQAPSKEEAERWVHALQMAAQAELPSPEKLNR